MMLTVRSRPFEIYISIHLRLHFHVVIEQVEINNTDAEGRLVLSDGVAYAARHLDPAVIIDMATLTGAQGVTTGRRHAAVLSNDEGLETMAVACGRSSGDLVHPVVYCPEFFTEEFRCDVIVSR